MSEDAILAVTVTHASRGLVHNVSVFIGTLRVLLDERAKRAKSCYLGITKKKFVCK